MPTAVIGIREMLAELIESDEEGLNALLSGKKVYAGKALPNSPLNYIVLGQTTETPEGAGYYRHPGHLGTANLHCWARTLWTAQQIFARLAELLDQQRPVVSGHTVMRGVLDYVTDAPGDPEGKTWQVIARYRVRSLVQAA